MPSWGQLLQEMDSKPLDERSSWLVSNFENSLVRIAELRGHNVLIYGSAFLQKPQLGLLTAISSEDVNGLMASFHGMDCSKGLTIILHTPGGVTTATDSIVAYLWSKFSFIEVIVPTFAMSAGTMISLASNQIIMGRHSQLGPIDTQMVIGGRQASARGVLGQFEMARKDIEKDTKAAHLWAPILQNLAPALIVDARNALEYAERMVAEWLQQRMFASHADPAAAGQATAKHFNDADTHKNHGRRIGRDEARAHNVAVLDLEADAALQEAVLTSYHLMTMLFERSPASKVMMTSTGQSWLKNHNAGPG